MSVTRNLFDLDGHTALITGGSRGLGLQMAEALGEYGARLFIAARKSEELERAQAHLQARASRWTGWWLCWQRGIASSSWPTRTQASSPCRHLITTPARAGARGEDYPLEDWTKSSTPHPRSFPAHQPDCQALDDSAASTVASSISPRLPACRGNPPGAMKTTCLQTRARRPDQPHAPPWRRVGAVRHHRNALAAAGLFPTRMSKGSD